MGGVGYAAALVLAAVFAWAGVAKLGRRERTARSFAAMGLPPGAAVWVPAVELVTALGLVVVPGWAAVAALALLAGFTVFLARAVAGGAEVGCGCFGSAGGDAVSWVDVARNGLLGVAAVAALSVPRPLVPSPGAVVLIAAAAVGGAGALRLARRR